MHYVEVCRKFSNFCINICIYPANWGGDLEKGTKDCNLHNIKLSDCYKNSMQEIELLVILFCLSNIKLPILNDSYAN